MTLKFNISLVGSGALIVLVACTEPAWIHKNRGHLAKQPRLMREHDLQAPHRMGQAHGPRHTTARSPPRPLRNSMPCSRSTTTGGAGVPTMSVAR